MIGGPGAAIFATGGFNEGLDVGALGVSIAFGFSFLCMAYLIGRFVGGKIGAGIIALVLSGTDGYLSQAQDAGLPRTASANTRRAGSTYCR